MADADLLDPRRVATRVDEQELVLELEGREVLPQRPQRPRVVRQQPLEVGEQHRVLVAEAGACRDAVARVEEVQAFAHPAAALDQLGDGLRRAVAIRRRGLRARVGRRSLRGSQHEREVVSGTSPPSGSSSHSRTSGRRGPRPAAPASLMAYRSIPMTIAQFAIALLPSRGLRDHGEQVVHRLGCRDRLRPSGGRRCSAAAAARRPVCRPTRRRAAPRDLGAGRRDPSTNRCSGSASGSAGVTRTGTGSESR